MAAVTGVFALLGAAGVEAVLELGLDAWALLDAALFAGAGWGMYRYSRAAAVLGTLLFVLAKALSLAHSPVSAVLALFLLMAFIGAIRGSFALAKMGPEAEPELEQLATPPVGSDNAYAPPRDAP